MSSKFVMVCKNCKFLSGPYNGVDTWFSCSCGERCFLSSRDIRSGKWRKFNRSVIPKCWLMCDQPIVVQTLEPHILRSIRLQDCELSDNESEEDTDTVEDFDPERIADDLEDEYDSDQEEDSEEDSEEEGVSEISEEEDSEEDSEEEEEEDYDSEEDYPYEDSEEEMDGRTMEEIDEEYEARYAHKRSR